MEQVKLSAEARQSLEQRLAELDDERIPRLERELAETGDPVVEAALRATRDEAGRVREALARATPLEEEPHDPTIVEMGDTVTVREEGSDDLERFTIVGELEARIDSSWISVKSPLGSALLDGRLGQIVEVKTPSGLTRYEVLGIER
jgi:transcription elongation factor GreA